MRFADLQGKGSARERGGISLSLSRLLQPLNPQIGSPSSPLLLRPPFRIIFHLLQSQRPIFSAYVPTILLN